MRTIYHFQIELIPYLRHSYQRRLVPGPAVAPRETEKPGFLTRQRLESVFSGRILEFICESRPRIWLIYADKKEVALRRGLDGYDLMFCPSALFFRQSLGIFEYVDLILDRQRHH